MVDPVSLIIPVNYLPMDGRFGAGPSKIRSEQLEALVRISKTYLGTSHRQQTVRNEVARLRSGLTQLFSLPEGYEVVLGNGGSTAFWEVATFGLIQNKAQFLSFGEFGSKFAASASAAPHLGDQVVIKSDPGEAPKFSAEKGVDTYCTPHNETSTGVAVKPYRPNNADEDALVVIDATSAAGGLDVDLAELDVYYFSPQKCFASDGGLWVAIMSPRAINRAFKIKDSGRYIPAFLDLVTAIENSRLDQTYNTPGLATIFLMNEQIDWFNQNGGLKWCVERTTKSSSIIYNWVEKSSFAKAYVANQSNRSSVVATINFSEKVDANQVAKILRQNGIVDVEPYRKLGENQLRISVFPSVDPADVQALTECINFVVENFI